MTFIKHKTQSLVITPIFNIDGESIIDNSLLDELIMEHDSKVKVYDKVNKSYHTLYPSMIDIKKHFIVKDNISHIILN